MDLFDQTPDLTEALLYFQQFKPSTYHRPYLAEQKSLLALLDTCKGQPCFIRHTSLYHNTYTYYFFPTVVLQESRVRHTHPVFILLKHTLSPETIKEMELPSRIATSDLFV